MVLTKLKNGMYQSDVGVYYSKRMHKLQRTLLVDDMVLQMLAETKWTEKDIYSHHMAEILRLEEHSRALLAQKNFVDKYVVVPFQEHTPVGDD